MDEASITEKEILIDDIWLVLRELPKTEKTEKAIDALVKLEKMGTN